MGFSRRAKVPDRIRILSCLVFAGSGARSGWERPGCLPAECGRRALLGPWATWISSAPSGCDGGLGQPSRLWINLRAENHSDGKAGDGRWRTGQPPTASRRWSLGAVISQAAQRRSPADEGGGIEVRTQKSRTPPKNETPPPPPFPDLLHIPSADRDESPSRFYLIPLQTAAMLHRPSAHHGTVPRLASIIHGSRLHTAPVCYYFPNTTDWKSLEPIPSRPSLPGCCFRPRHEMLGRRALIGKHPDAHRRVAGWAGRLSGLMPPSLTSNQTADTCG